MRSLERTRQALASDGFALIEQTLSEETLGSLQTAVTALRASARPMSRQVLYTHTRPPARPPLTALMDQWLNPHHLDGDASTRAAAEAIRPLASELLGEPAILFQDLLLIKQPGQRHFPWHQDFPFWPIDRPEAVVIWAPLVATGPSGGALRFARGSHSLGARPVVDLHTGDAQRPEAALGFNPERWDIAAPDYRAGDLVVFSPLIFHGSPPTRRTQPRPAWASVWLSPRCRWSYAAAPNHPLCRRVEDGAPVTEHIPGGAL